MKLTINEIADIARVAKSTVSKALNGQKGVSDDTRRRILELAERLRYEPSASAQALSSSRTGSIGLFIPHEAGTSLSGAYWSAIATSVAHVAGERNHSLLILTPARENDLSPTIETVIRRRNVDGLIIGAEQLDPSLTTRLADEEIPFVLIGRNARIRHYSVDVDNEGGSERLVSHLVASGFRNIACLSGPAEYSYNQERVAGYRTALRKAGLTWTAGAHSGYATENARDAAARIVREYPDMDALYATAGGEFLLDCIDGFRLAGADPRSFGFGTFDDYRFFGYLDIPVCSIRQPLKEIGATAAGLLFSLLAGELPDRMNHVLDVDLVARQEWTN